MRTGYSMLVAAVVLGTLSVAYAQNVSTVLAQYPQYSKFNDLLKTTGVLAQVNARNSMTILLIQDGVLNGYVSSHPSYTTQMVADVIRYHCLLQYFSIDEIKAQVVPLTVTTLYQTTGRANGTDGSVNVTAQTGGIGTVGGASPGANTMATIVTNVTQFPYNYSFLEISSVLEPINLVPAQLAPTAPPSMAPGPVPAPLTSTPTPSPVESPTSTPVKSPTSTPVKAPSSTPSESPSETPVNPPVPSAPVTEGPSSVPGPSSGSVLEVSFIALVASAVAAAFAI